MAGRLNLEILTPERIVESLEVEQVTLPGTEGQFGVLPGHAALLSSLEIGEMSFSVAGEKTYYAVNRGFAEVFQNRVMVLVETAERADEIAPTVAAIEAATGLPVLNLPKLEEYFLELRLVA